MSNWRIFVQDEPWLDRKSLWVTRRASPAKGRKLEYATGFTFVEVPEGTGPDSAGAVPLCTHTRIDEEDRITTFLQAVLDEAWRVGMRPRGYQDHENEMKAVRYHLEDMRLLAKVKK